MTLLAEYALLHDIFDSTSYSNDEVGSIRLQQLKEVMLNEGLVRNLRNGKWLSVFENENRPWLQRRKELLKKLKLQGRLHQFPDVLSDNPKTDSEWCQEALASNENLKLSGIITTKNVSQHFSNETLVAPIERLSSTPWWSERSSSTRLLRTIDNYKKNLNLVLQCSKSIMFIDPHLDPTRHRYKKFSSLFNIIVSRHQTPLIEVHRVCYFGSGANKELISENEWKRKFYSEWKDILKSYGFSVNVFIWDDFHDRYLISNLIGVNIPNGFDTTNDPNSTTTWTRLGRTDRDDIQREFDPATNRHNLKYRFNVP